MNKIVSIIVVVIVTLIGICIIKALFSFLKEYNLILVPLFILGAYGLNSKGISLIEEMPYGHVIVYGVAVVVAYILNRVLADKGDKILENIRYKIEVIVFSKEGARKRAYDRDYKKLGYTNWTEEQKRAFLDKIYYGE